MRHRAPVTFSGGIPMSHPISRRRHAALATAAGLTTAVVALAGTSLTASAVPADVPSTPVPITAPDGTVMSYVLNAESRTPARHGSSSAPSGAPTASSSSRGRRSASSSPTPTGSTFRAAVRDRRRQRPRVGRCDPHRRPSPRAPPRASPRRGALVRPTTRRAPRRTATATSAAEPTPAGRADPREAEQWDMPMIKADQAHQITDGSPQRPRRRARQRHRRRPPRPRRQHRRRQLGQLHRRRPTRPSATGWQPTTSDHGTHVAGTIAAARNGVGIVGVAPDVRMASVKVVNDDGFIYPEYAVCGFV